MPTYQVIIKRVSTHIVEADTREDAADLVSDPAYTNDPDTIVGWDIVSVWPTTTA